MAQIFISYNKRDRDLAERVAAALRSEGLTAWWDDDVTPRENWDRQLEREIESADKVLVLWTRNSVESDWVRIEANWARSCVPSKLVQARFDHVQIPIAFSLVQYVDLDWDHFAEGHSWRKLLWFLAENAAAAEGSAEADELARIRRLEITAERRRQAELDEREAVRRETERAAEQSRREAVAAEERARAQRADEERIEGKRRRWLKRVAWLIGIAVVITLGYEVIKQVVRAVELPRALTWAGRLNGNGHSVTWTPKSYSTILSLTFDSESDLLDDGCAPARVRWRGEKTLSLNEDRPQICMPPDRLELSRRAKEEAATPLDDSPDFRPWELKFE